MKMGFSACHSKFFGLSRYVTDMYLTKIRTTVTLPREGVGKYGRNVQESSEPDRRGSHLEVEHVEG